MKKYQIYGIGAALVDTEVVVTNAFLSTYKIDKGLKVACIEEIVFKQGYISKQQLIRLAQPLIKNQYGQYVLKCAEGGF